MVRYYYNYFSIKLWKNFRLIAIDGTCLNLPSCKDLNNEFGQHYTTRIGAKGLSARVSFAYDVLNFITIDANLSNTKDSEQNMMKSHFKMMNKNDLCILDRNYGYISVFKRLAKQKLNFCIRLSSTSGYFKRFIDSGLEEQIVNWKAGRRETIKKLEKEGFDNSPIHIRFIRVELGNGDIEVLATSLLNHEKYPHQEFKELYSKRWGVEESIKKYKKNLIIEFFSAKTKEGILQDFYANVFLLNLTSIMSENVHEEVNAITKHRKFKYQINWSSAIYDMRHYSILLFIRKSVSKIITAVQLSFKQNVEAIRYSRSFTRGTKKVHKDPYTINYKPVM